MHIKDLKLLKLYYLAICFFSLISCKKVNLDFEKTGLFEKNDKVVQNVAISNTSISGDNGYYYLPEEHPNVFEKNNYLVKITNGQIVQVYRGT